MKNPLRIVTWATLLTMIIGLATLLVAQAVPTQVNFGEVSKVKRYTVQAIRGVIRNKTRDVRLARRSVFRSSDTLTFADKAAKMIIIDEARQSFLTTRSEREKGYALRPVRSAAGTRDGPLLNEYDIEGYLGVDSFYILGDTLRLPVSTIKFPQNESSFFLVRYTWRGEKIDKVLSSDDGQIIIDAPTIYKVDGVPIDRKEVSDHYLIYYHPEREVAISRICAFNPVFLDNDILLEEITILLERTNIENRSGRYKQVNDFLFNFYGRVDGENLEYWWRNNF